MKWWLEAKKEAVNAAKHLENGPGGVCEGGVAGVVEKGTSAEPSASWWCTITTQLRRTWPWRTLCSCWPCHTVLAGMAPGSCGRVVPGRVQLGWRPLGQGPNRFPSTEIRTSHRGTELGQGARCGTGLDDLSCGICWWPMALSEKRTRWRAMRRQEQCSPPQFLQVGALQIHRRKIKRR